MIREAILAVAAATAFFAAGAVALAQSGEPSADGGTAAGGHGENQGWRGSLTLGVGLQPDYEGSDDYEVIPVAMSRLEWRGFGFYSYGSRAQLDLLPDDRLMAGPVFNYRFGRDEVDDGRVDALPDVDDAVELGLFFGARLPIGDDPRELVVPSVSFLHDVSGAHGGWLATGDVSATFVLLRPLALTLGGSTTWASEDYQQTYFGIGAGGAASSGLAQHDAGAGFRDASLRATLDLYLSETWSLGPTLIYKRLLGDAADGPVVEEAGSADQFIGFVSTTWRF
ncbi:MAG: MipA/OmpV family protein [Tistlia sp.]|uniref:MipA/OmpV family protein n=1 Tax=Tistlia sp. TaxID=3057121 RepID=UPI0034A59127